MAVVELEGVEKRYGRIEALRGLSLRLEGGAVGLLGPNGAGKTTLLRLLLGLARPDAGRVRVVGFDPTDGRGRMEVRRRVGYVPESECLAPGASAVELVSTLARLSGLRRRDALARAHEALDYVGLEEERYRRVEQYSAGMRQRLKLAQALAHDPPLLLLDEPTNGLDPAGRRHMLALVRDLTRARGKHVLVSSHLLPDVERTCERVVVLREGRLLSEGAVDAWTRGEAATLRVRLDGPAAGFAAELATRGAACEEARGGRLRVELPAGADGDLVLAAAARAGAVVRSMELARPTLEDALVAALGAPAGSPAPGAPAPGAQRTGEPEPGGGA